MIMKKLLTSTNMAKLGIFSALAIVLYLINIPLPFLFPPFLKLNLSDLPILICSFAMGPLAGVVSALAKILIKLPLSDTFGVGELSDFINTLAFILPASIIYHRAHNKMGALIGMIVGSVASVLTSLLSNRFIIIPFYLTVMEFSLEKLAGICSSVLPNVTAQNFYWYYLPFAVLPFNALRCIVNSIVTYLTYKRISIVLKDFGNKNISSSARQTFKAGERYAKTLNAGDVVLLKGEMGAGKTVFVKGVAKGLGITDEVTSPTYAYMNDYDGKLYHYDCYRLSSGEDAEALGLTDYFYAGGICIIEWSENIKSVLPENCKVVCIEKLDEKRRNILF